MAGGLLNFIAAKASSQNIIFNGNPTKSFFKSKYVKYTNFAMEKYRIDPVGNNKLQFSPETIIKFEMKRYADLLMDTYLVVTLPDIWSPIYQSVQNGEIEFRPYEFQWIKNIGTQIIKEVEFTFGGTVVQRYSGNYIQNMVERDFDANKKELFNIMIGNVPELYDPANYSNRAGNYPNAWKLNDLSTNTVEPSIHSHQLFVPLNSWFSLMTTTALPLVCLQYVPLNINFRLRPVTDLFTIKDVLYDTSLNPANINIDNYDEIPRIHAFQSGASAYGFYRFIQEPPQTNISSSYVYVDQRKGHINHDIHLLCTQCFLDNEERTLFSNNPQEYLFKEIKEYNFERIKKSGKIKIESNGSVSNWMWYMQRNDVNQRNEWSNYSNWPYENVLPNNLKKLTVSSENGHNHVFYNTNTNYAINDSSKNIFITGYEPTVYEQTNRKEILKDFGIICDGKYREETRTSGVYNKIEKYNRTAGNSKEGLYCYSFSLSTDPLKYQPSGVFNTNKFRTIEFEYNNHANPPIDFSGAQFTTICDPETNEIVGVTKDPTNIYQYNYNLYVFEEKYNILRIQSGMAELAYGQ